nr:hypothetical protein Iba_chr09eCG10940 [Ipomoea batatas]
MEYVIVASKGKSYDTKSIENVENPGDLFSIPEAIIGDVGEATLGHGESPYEGTVRDGGKSSKQRHSGNGVQVWELREEDGGARSLHASCGFISFVILRAFLSVLPNGGHDTMGGVGATDVGSIGVMGADQTSSDDSPIFSHHRILSF